MRARRTSRSVALACALTFVAGAIGSAKPDLAGATQPAAHHRVHCHTRTLVLSAMPVELSPLLTQEKVRKTVVRHNRSFYFGRLRGHSVILALTGIGPVNARHTTHHAIKTFRCHNGRRRITSIVFSGVAGGDFIGNVTVPTKWTMDAGKHFYGVDRHMLQAARRTARHHVRLEQKTPTGDPLCACVADPDTVKSVSVTHRPRIEFGGKGQTTDPFAGGHLPCVPGGGDVFGCDPCPEKPKLSEPGHFAKGLKKFADPKYLAGYLSTPAEGKQYVAEDEETAAVDAVAHHHHVPFLGFRAVSDGGGDPLGLPGFPFEFFYYRQLAADNAALTTMAFLKTWRHR